MRHDDYPFPDHFLHFCCGAESKRAVESLLTFLRIFMLWLFTFARIIFAWNVLRGMRELLFRQFTLALGSYHWYAVIRANLSLLREFVGIQNAGNGSVNNSLHLYLWTQSARTALRVTSLSLVATIFASNRFVSPVLALLVIDCDRSLVAPKKEVIRKMTTLFGSFSTSEALFPPSEMLWNGTYLCIDDNQVHTSSLRLLYHRGSLCSVWTSFFLEQV